MGIRIIEVDTSVTQGQEATNSQHPFDTAELLRALADKLDAQCQSEKRDDGRTPFFVQHIAFDLREGYVTAYIKDNM